MKKQIYNPYLPLYEYVPDGEPHVFNGRVYVYGSHDQYGAFAFCHNDYVTWSAPIDNLKDWRYEGVILSKREDPENKNGKHDLFAPDVCQGPDGKFYIYYAYDWMGHTGVAVSDSPAGPFKFHGYVSFPDGTVLGSRKKDVFQFDPGVLVDDDGRVYLYSGFGPKPGQAVNMNIKGGMYADACYCIELEPDMVTIKGEPKKVMERKGVETDPAFNDGHEFFEASSPRKINGKYYMVYSSFLGHELCYAISDSPWGPFKFGGTIISNGDVGLNGRTKDNACYPLGNNHGGLVNVKGDWYVFYHRHTNYTNTDRQGCAEEIVIKEDGSIDQVEMTSCGLNGGPLEGKGTYPASICCCLMPKEGNIFYNFFRWPWQKGKMCITQSGKDTDTVETQYIENIADGALVGYKYFNLTETKTVTLEVKGKASGKAVLEYSENGEAVSTVDFEVKGEGKITLPVVNGTEKNAVYIKFTDMKGKLDAYKLCLE
mgnify:CR=1 FL=1